MVRQKVIPLRLEEADRRRIESDFLKRSAPIEPPNEEIQERPKKRRRSSKKEDESDDIRLLGIDCLPPCRVVVRHSSALDHSMIWGTLLRVPIAIPLSVTDEAVENVKEMVFFHDGFSSKELKILMLLKSSEEKQWIWLYGDDQLTIHYLDAAHLCVVIDETTLEELRSRSTFRGQRKLNLCVLLRKSCVMTNPPYPATYPKTMNEESRMKISALVSTLTDGEVPSAQSLKVDEEGGNDLKHVDAFLRKVREHQLDEISAVCSSVQPQHPRLNLPLRRYQCESVQWMVQKETKEYIAKDLYERMYFPITTMEEKTLWYSPYHSHFLNKEPALLPNYKGGLLCDEMGLGKTLEVLSLLLCHPCSFWQATDPLDAAKVFTSTEFDEPDSSFECVCGSTGVERRGKKKFRVKCNNCPRTQHAHCMGFDGLNPHRGSYTCPRCLVRQLQSDEKAPVTGKATLVVTPETIADQWCDEVCKHVQNVRVVDSRRYLGRLHDGFDDRFTVMVYHGVQQKSYTQPNILAGCDIVLTTYTVLQRDLNHIFFGETKESLRPENQRYMTKPSPLMAVHWWRVCLDEAQLATSKSESKAATMAKQLSAENRWCITGTPISSSIRDLQRFLSLLSIDPFWVPQWWDNLVVQPFRRLQMVKDPACAELILSMLVPMLSRYMWRTHKIDVTDQINLKSQSVNVHYLQFSAVERFIYNTCLEEARAPLRNLCYQMGENANCPLESVSGDIYDKIMANVSRVRQSCSHPSLIRTRKDHMFKLQANTTTKAEVLQQLKKQNTGAMVEHFRKYQLNMNGQAGLKILEGEYDAAANIYRTLLVEARREKEFIDVDTLQQLHVFVNLKWLLTAHQHDISGRSMQEDQLMNEVTALHKRHIKRTLKNASSAIEGWRQYQVELVGLISPRELRNWMEEAIAVVYECRHFKTLMDHVNASSISNLLGFTVFRNQDFGDIHLLHSIIMRLLDEMETCHNRVLKVTKTLNIEDEIENSKLTPAGTICAPPYVEVFYQCCAAKHRMDDGAPKPKVEEKCDFCHCEDLVNQLEKAVFGNKRSAMIQLFDGLRRIVERERGPDERADGVRHRLETLRESYYMFSKLLCERRMLAGTFDELNQAVNRYTMSREDTYGLVRNNTFIDSMEMLRCRRMHHEMEADAEKMQYQRLKANKRFFDNLSDGGLKDGEKPADVDSCPICMSVVSSNFIVYMPCGHSICNPCFSKMVGRRNVCRCPTCRQLFTPDEVKYALISNQDDEVEYDTEDIVGDHCTKVRGIVRCLKEIQSTQPGSKALVFSVWPRVLEVIHNALVENGIKHVSLCDPKDARASLIKFRSNDDLTVLLLPTRSGCNGLNLIEANHVLLVEPILDPGQEAQAISRVHRIGQTRKTVVHHFLVKNTLEPQLHKLTREAASSCSSLQTAPKGSVERCCVSLNQMLKMMEEQ